MSNRYDRKTKDKLLIIGASGHGKVVADIAISMHNWQYIAFLDDNVDIQPPLGMDVIGRSSEASRYIAEYDVIVAIGDNKIREKVQTQLEEAGANIPVLIHPCAVIGEQVEVGTGTVVMAGVVINCSSRVGSGCIVNTGATIDHDNILEAYVHLSPGVHTGGNVGIGKGTWLGVGSAVINNINITGGCIIGAGAVVIGDIKEAGTYIGIPAKKLVVQKPAKLHMTRSGWD